jgi:RNase P/RNase MRP subunit p30
VEREEGFLKVENVEFRCDDKRQIVISLRNGTKRSVVVDAVYVNGKSQKINRVAIEPKSVKDVVLDFDWSENEVYNIKVCTSEGICLKEVSKA